MSADNRPFFNIKLECPICGNLNVFEVIKQGAYTESGRDTDFAPTGRAWANPVYQKYNPLLYFTATCNSCYYSRELNSTYKEWQNNSNFKSYKLPGQKAKHQEANAIDNGIIKFLGSHISNELFPSESAVIKLLLAIYDELLLDRPTALDIARFYLRIAWIYRDMNVGEESSDPAQLMLSKIQLEIDRLKKNVEDFGSNLPSLHQMISADFKPTVNINSTAGISTKLIPAIESVHNVWSSMQKDILNLQAQFNNVKKEVLAQKSAMVAQDGFVEFPSFREFLYKAREIWTDIPVVESEALVLALENYLKAYQNSREIKPGLQQLQASYMIAELARRVGDFEKANEYFKITTRQSQDMMTRSKGDKSLYANAKKILEMSLEQNRLIKKSDKVNA